MDTTDGLRLHLCSEEMIHPSGVCTHIAQQCRDDPCRVRLWPFNITLFTVGQQVTTSKSTREEMTKSLHNSPFRSKNVKEHRISLPMDGWAGGLVWRSGRSDREARLWRRSW